MFTTDSKVPHAVSDKTIIEKFDHHVESLHLLLCVRVCAIQWYMCMLQTFSSGNISERHLQKSFSPSNRGLQQDKQIY